MKYVERKGHFLYKEARNRESQTAKWRSELVENFRIEERYFSNYSRTTSIELQLLLRRENPFFSRFAQTNDFPTTISSSQEYARDDQCVRPPVRIDCDFTLAVYVMNLVFSSARITYANRFR